MADQLLLARQFDDSGAPGAGYVASFFLSGTTTPVTVYTDTGASIPAGTSVTANATGRFAQTFHPGGAILKCVITTPAGATVETLDPVPAVSISAGAAEDISFIPSIALPYDNLQDAVEGSVAAAASGFNAFGLGITGNAALLANIDAANIGAGVYRFDATTTGTFPTGAAAANTGLVGMKRQSSGAGFMFLQDATLNRLWYRRLASSTWQPWLQILTPTAGASAAAITGIQTAITDSDANLPTSGAVVDYVMPARLISGNGFVRLPNGLYIMWGSFTAAGDSTTFNYSTISPSISLSSFSRAVVSSTADGSSTAQENTAGVVECTTTGFRVYQANNSSITTFFIAVGA